ncbi:transposase [Rhodococcus ruber]|uniref:transposase n=1 Tax=Rhodococcus ruber TaxID=1830 RepID=UPI001EEF4B28|nr:transposase [Rhodococcus ruber]MCF8786237.1 transposase [Rhodococcus ruber]
MIDATFGAGSVGETTYTLDLLRGMRRGMIVLADRNFASQALLAAVRDTGAHLLVRVKNSRNLPVCARLPDGSYLCRMGSVEVRVLCCEITITTSAGARTETYNLVTTLLDPDCPATEIVRLYHERWEIETAFLELKTTLLGGRVLRARTRAGSRREIYALLVTYQALRVAISDATLGCPDVDPDRASFTLALKATRDQLIHAAGVIETTVIDLVGIIGEHVLDHLMPARRLRTNPRVVKRAISNFVTRTARGRTRGPSLKATVAINILTDIGPYNTTHALTTRLWG